MRIDSTTQSPYVDRLQGENLKVGDRRQTRDAEIPPPLQGLPKDSVGSTVSLPPPANDLTAQDYTQALSKLGDDTQGFSIEQLYAVMLKFAESEKKAAREDREMLRLESESLLQQAADKMRLAADMALTGAVVGGAASIIGGAVEMRGAAKGINESVGGTKGIKDAVGSAKSMATKAMDKFMNLPLPGSSSKATTPEEFEMKNLAAEDPEPITPGGEEGAEPLKQNQAQPEGEGQAESTEKAEANRKRKLADNLVEEEMSQSNLVDDSNEPGGTEPSHTNSVNTSDKPKGTGQPKPGDKPEGTGQPKPGDKPEGTGQPKPGDKPEGTGQPKPGDKPDEIEEPAKNGKDTKEDMAKMEMERMEADRKMRRASGTSALLVALGTILKGIFDTEDRDTQADEKDIETASQKTQEYADNENQYYSDYAAIEKDVIDKTSQYLQSRESTTQTIVTA